MILYFAVEFTPWHVNRRMPTLFNIRSQHNPQTVFVKHFQNKNVHDFILEIQDKSCLS